MPDWADISARIMATGAQAPDSKAVRAAGGGSISAAYVLGAGDHQYFVKTCPARQLSMFAAERAGLEEISRADCIRVPRVICDGVAGHDAFLVLEYLPMKGTGSGACLGEQLAQMHRHQQTRFGWSRNNTIGSTPQVNVMESDWLMFWAQYRLDFQLNLAQKNGAGPRILEKGRRLSEGLPGLFNGYRPVASLLHGDLWSGNYGYLEDGQPVIFDPAVYYGDREADIAMTELFGGFPADFYAAYQLAYPLDAGYAVRKTLYNLYHVLNHYNLFGGAYLAQAQDMIEQLLSDLG